MTGDRWTLLLLRGERSPIRQFSLSPRLIHVGIWGLVVLAISLSGLAATVSRDGAARLEARRLARENTVLTEELSAFQGRVNSAGRPHRRAHSDGLAPPPARRAGLDRRGSAASGDRGARPGWARGQPPLVYRLDNEQGRLRGRVRSERARAPRQSPQVEPRRGHGFAHGAPATCSNRPPRSFPPLACSRASSPSDATTPFIIFPCRMRVSTSRLLAGRRSSRLRKGG